MNAWQSYAVTVAVHLTAITLVAAVAMTVFRRRPALRHAIGVVALSFLLACPILTLLLPKAAWLGGPRVTASVVNSESHESSPTSSIEFLPSSTAAPKLQPVANDADPVRLHARSSVEQTAGSPSTTRTEMQPRGLRSFFSADLKMWFVRTLNTTAGVWLVGVVILSRRMFLKQREIRCFANSLRGVSVAAGAAEDARRALGLEKLPRIATSEMAPMPVVVGCLRPVVVLPQAFAETASAARLRDVLVHECAHIVRGDPWIHIAQQWAAIIFWPHPGVHWLNRLLAQAREEVCDNFVLLRGNSADYAQTLLELAESCGSPRIAVSLGLFSRRWTLEERIAGVLNPRRNTMTRTRLIVPLIAAICIFAISILIGGVGAWGQVASDREASPSAEGTEKPAAKVKKIKVHGLCQDQHSEPIVGARVRVFRMKSYADPYELVAEARTDEEGKFSIPNVEMRRDVGWREGMTDLTVVAIARGHVSALKMLDDLSEGWASLVMADNPSTLSGVVTDEHGKPLEGANVFISVCGSQPVPEMMSSIADAQGHYSITDLKSWNAKDTETFDPKTGIGTICAGCYFLLQHPDYALTRGMYTAIPQEVNVNMHPPAIVEGHVTDGITGRPLANRVVFAQGIAQSYSHQTRTDNNGHYRLRMNKDHYNVWAEATEADDRIAIAVKALQAEPGKTVKDADVRLVRGGFVFGTVIDSSTGKPLIPPLGHPQYVAHYGPARPRTGAAVTSTPINVDGTYRLRVAPGRNYIYLMDSTKSSSAYVEVADGAEVKLDLRTGESVSREAAYSDPDVKLSERLHRLAREEEAEKNRVARGEPPSPAKRKRLDTPTGRLLDELEDQNEGSAFLEATWLGTLKAIADLGPAAVPELVTELDATSNRRMISCVAFTLRAIDDKRAVPALIRTIPKTLGQSGSDMGVRCDDEELLKFAQKYDLDRANEGNRYGFGRAVREVFGSLQKLTGHRIDEEELYSVHLEGSAAQKQMKRKLFDRTAKKWAEWWEQNSKEHVNDVAYWKVNLPDPPADEVRGLQPGTRYKTVGGGSNWILQSVFNPQAQAVFYDCDTGRKSALPKKWRGDKELEKRMDEITAWAAEEGFDIMGTEYAAADGKRYFALRGIGLKAWELSPDYWKKELTDITVEQLQKQGALAKDLLLHFDPNTKSFDPKATAPFVYVTREGTPGLLYVGIEVQDDSLKPGGVTTGDNELNPVAFYKGRRFGFSKLAEIGSIRRDE